MGKVFCQNCGYENKDKMKFCTNCGTKLEKETASLKKEENENRFCEECGHPIELGQIFCENCGNRVNPEEEIPEEVEEEQELEESEMVEGKSQEDEEQEVELSEETEEESELKEEESSFIDDEKNENLEQDSNEIDESEVRFCKNCGKRLKSTQDFCPSCGTKANDNEDDLDNSSEELEEESIELEDEVEEVHEIDEVEEEIEDTEESEETNSLEEEKIGLEKEQPYCTKCGKKLKKGQDFCTHCGTKIGETNKTESLDSQEEKSNKKKLLIILLFLLLIICSIVVCVVWKPGKKKDKETEQKEVLITVPSVIDKSQKEAIQILEDLSFKVKIIEEEIEDSEKVGIVFEQDPVDKKLKRESEVTIKVYTSIEKIEMIPIVGDTLEDATKKLEAIGVATKIIEQESDTVEKGKIISQEVSEGENISKGSTVTITVSTGKEESPTPTSTPKATSNSKNTPKPTPTSTPTSKANWSNWTASLPSNVNSNTYEIETKTQYRSRSKETTTSTSSSLSGWTQYDTKSEIVYSGNKTATVPWNEYNDFKNNKNYQIISEEVIERDITYGYCKSNNNNVYHSAPQVSHTCPEGTRYVTMLQTSTTLLDTSIINTYVSKNLYDGTGSHLVLVTKMEPFKYTITYKEKTGENNTYYFYRWGSWSSWQDNQITSNDSTDVSTRTMYRYRVK